MMLFLLASTLLTANLIRAALRHADISVTKAALWMEMDRSQFERQLSGEGHVSLNRLEKLPLLFWQWTALLMVEWFGLPPEVEQALAVDDAMFTRRRMVKVESATERETA